MRLVKTTELFWGLVGALALLVGLFSALGIIQSILLIVATAIIALVVSSIARRYYRYQIMSAKEDIGDFRHPIEYDFDEIYLLDKTVFRQAELIPKEIFMLWYRANKNTFTVLCLGERVIGYYSILPLQQNTLNSFLKGKISESEFTKEDIMNVQEAQNTKEVYFFSIVISKEYRQRGYQLLQHTMDELKTKASYPKLEKIYATAATSDGRRILQRRGFMKIADADTRKDHHDLYEYSFD